MHPKPFERGWIDNEILFQQQYHRTNVREPATDPESDWKQQFGHTDRNIGFVRFRICSLYPRSTDGNSSNRIMIDDKSPSRETQRVKLPLECIVPNTRGRES